MPKGSRPGERRGGRKRGTPNKVTGALKDLILQALSNVGGVAYLETQAEKNPNAFMGLVGRVLPLQVKQGGDEPKMPSSYTVIANGTERRHEIGG